MDIRTVASRLEALGNETRLEVYRILVRAGRDGLPVGDVQSRTGVAITPATYKMLIAPETHG